MVEREAAFGKKSGGGFALLLLELPVLLSFHFGKEKSEQHKILKLKN